jgi:DeoR/GlpR family transcriptional regulator of sugar metabolism
MVEIKESLARGVVGLVESGQTIFIDAGSTNVAVARRLPRDKAITVVTNAPNVAVSLADHQRSKVILLGGVFNSEKGACLGGQTLKEAQRIYADMLILGTCGADPDVGITTLDAEEAELKRCMVRQSGRLILPLTLDKLGTVAPYKVADSAEADVVLVPQGASTDLLGRFEAIGTLIRSVPNGPS